MSATLELSDLCVGFGGRAVLEGASVRFEDGARWAVIGRSGAGKSVLMKAAAGLLPFSSGRVRLLVENEGTIEAGPKDEAAFARLRKRLAFVHQDPALLDDLSVRENAAFALVRRGGKSGGKTETRAETEARVERWLAALSLDDVADRLPNALSPGQLRRVALCRALCLAPDLLVVDEPTTGLDPLAAREVDDALASLSSTGTTLIVITHDRRSLDRLSPRIAWVDRRRVRYVGDLEGARRSEEEDLRALLEGRPPRTERQTDDRADDGNGDERHGENDGERGEERA